MVYKQKEIEDWAKAMGIYTDPNFYAQMKGIAEEVVEVLEAYNIDNDYGAKLETELGDIFVWWVNACKIAGIEPEHAADSAYNKVIKRTGKVVNGRFVKDGY